MAAKKDWKYFFSREGVKDTVAAYKHEREQNREIKEAREAEQKIKAEEKQKRAEERDDEPKTSAARETRRGNPPVERGMTSGYRSFGSGEGANSFWVFLFLCLVIAFHVFDYNNGFGTSLYLRLVVGMVFLIFAFLAFNEGEAVNFDDTGRLKILAVFFVLFAIPPSLVIKAVSENLIPNSEKLVGGIFLALPFWFIYLLFCVKARLKSLGVIKVIFVLMIFFIFIGQTGTYANENLNMNVPKVDTVGALDNLRTSLAKGIGVFTSIPAQAQTEYQKQQYYATHGYYEGDVADSKQTTQLELADPSYLNLLEYTGKEKEIQIGTKVNALNIENKMNLYFECSAVPEDCSKNCTSKSVQPSPQSILNEVTVSEDVWCYVKSKDFSPGYNKLTFKATARGVDTKAQLRKFFIDKTTLDSKFVAYVKTEGMKLSTPEDITYVIKKIYPNAKGADLSLSEDAPAKLIISTSQSPVIGIKDGMQIQMILAFENNAKGYISKINSLELTYPEGLEPREGFCSAFIAADGKIKLAPGQAALFNLSGIARGEQRSFSACSFNVTDASKLLDTPSNINERSFEAKMTYDYTAEKEYSVKYGEKSTGLPFSGLFAGSGLVWPTNVKSVSSCYGWRELNGGDIHDGIDIDTISADTIYAAGDGVVEDVCPAPCSGYGNSITIKHHDALYTKYSHLSMFLVNEGDSVTAGQEIGKSGSTGASTGDHLDFKISFNGKFGDNVDFDSRNPLCLFPGMVGQIDFSHGTNCEGDAEFQKSCLGSAVS